ncbi:multifunctional acyl-CoA thioesterase I and protease I and lysophospholipase L1 [Sterolibacterium denitrificans]|uniref:Multifunctional acyl-CoA thioesterase I and protease I and lysophospholipase L1 n=2 Tax=Sterolibacterium denitrificans TaxID=157592 RepID=A0A7Z7HTE4_9PROT|nr:multifunctional acyl-CoA thioesterase I and protease I and lysophospholipase L1 [Sterolibacterium denitrificans]
MLRILRSIFWLMFLFAANSAPALATETILVMGDSLSAGYGIAKEQSWPALLSVRLHAEKFDYGMVNLSISGETSAGGRARLPAALKTHRPAVVILALGANDGLRGLPLAQMRENLASMIRQSQSHKARVLLVGMRLPPNYGAEYEAQFAAVYAELARQYKVALLPFLFEGFAEQRAAFQADGLHPTAATQPLMLENVWPVLKPLLKRPGR